MKHLMETIEESLAGTDYEVQSMDIRAGTLIITDDEERSYTLTVEEN